MPFYGRLPADPLAEVDLAIDPALDALTINTDGAVLEVSPAVTWNGRRAADPQEIDLAIDAAGDLLAIDPAGDVLEVSRTQWTGESAAKEV
jgi:hypothetical protein